MTRVATRRGVIVLLSLVITSIAGAIEQTGSVSEWNFDVYLDDKKVGQHLFTVSEVDGVTQVVSEAEYRVKFLFVVAYRYEHNASERWSDNCLVALDARTNNNGKRIQVVGEQAETGFVVESGDKPVELPECVMTFAYWNPKVLEQTRLLNPQTGEFVDVAVEKISDETLDVRGQSVAATRFKLTARELDLTLWYSNDNDWLALESPAKGGKVIRYELS